MAHILINGVSAKSGGGRSILRNFLGASRHVDHGHRLTVVTPAGTDYQEFASPDVAIMPLRSSGGPLFLLLFTIFGLPRLLLQMKCDLLFNPADVPVPTSLPQVFLFDWSYAAFPESTAWNKSGAKEQIVRKAKLFLFQRYMRHIDVLIAQNELLRDRLEILYAPKCTEVIPNAVSLENLGSGEPHDFRLPEGFKLLCLSAYYTHKNLEVLLPVARLIRERSLDCKIVLTLDPSQHPKGAALLDAVRSEALGNVVVNVGSVPMSRVPNLYRQTDALLLPTLLESFSGTYVEAMFHGKPILTSRLPFAEGVCKDAASYFDPMDPEEIVAEICRLMLDPALRAERVKRGEQVLAELPNWLEAATALFRIFDRTLASW